MRFAVLGAGTLGADFLTAGAAVQDFSLACVCARSERRAQRMLDACGVTAPVVRSARELAADASLDAVYIASAQPARFDQALMLLAAGKRVLTQAPAAGSEADYARLCETAAAYNTVCVQLLRAENTPGFAAARQALASLGALRGGELLRGAGDNGRPAAAAPERAAIPLAELMYFNALSAAALFGAPDGIQAQRALRDDGLELRLDATLSYGGAQVTLACSQTQTLGRGARIVCEGGVLVLDDLDWPCRVELVGDDRSETVYADNAPYAGTQRALLRFLQGETDDAQTARVAYALADRIKSAVGADIPMKLPHVGGFIR